ILTAASTRCLTSFFFCSNRLSRLCSMTTYPTTASDPSARPASRRMRVNTRLRRLSMEDSTEGRIGGVLPTLCGNAIMLGKIPDLPQRICGFVRSAPGGRGGVVGLRHDPDDV